ETEPRLRLLETTRAYALERLAESGEREAVAHHIDYLGAALLIVWAVALLLGFSLGGTELAWNSWQIIALFAIAVVGVVAFL
ncbi:hypothetical protein Q8G50_33600, partial [Klebsiella pneumoniae]